MKPSSRNKNQSSVHQDKEDNHLLVIKGSPGSVFAKCESILVNREDIKIDELNKKQFIEVKRMRILLGWV